MSINTSVHDIQIKLDDLANTFEEKHNDETILHALYYLSESLNN